MINKMSSMIIIHNPISDTILVPICDPKASKCHHLFSSLSNNNKKFLNSENYKYLSVTCNVLARLTDKFKHNFQFILKCPIQILKINVLILIHLLEYVRE